MRDNMMKQRRADRRNRRIRDVFQRRNNLTPVGMMELEVENRIKKEERK